MLLFQVSELTFLVSDVIHLMHNWNAIFSYHYTHHIISNPYCGVLTPASSYDPTQSLTHCSPEGGGRELQGQQ